MRPPAPASVVAAACNVSRPKSPSVDRPERLMASINLLAPAGNLWISVASCLVVTARVSSGNERRARTCCSMAFSCLLRGGFCWADEGTQPEKTAAISKARIRIVSSVYTPLCA